MEIRQQFAGMFEAARVYGNVGTSLVTEAADQLGLAKALAPMGAWLSADYDEYFANVYKQTSESTAHGEDSQKRGNVMDQCGMDGQETLGRTTAIAASCRV
jgi:hypothetical protein